MRIISGKYKGIKIPFTNSKFTNADVTTEKVKEAVFSILMDRINGSVFADVFACSGQIAYEAASRGAKKVLINEQDAKRFNFIKKFIRTIDFDDFEILNRNYKRFFKQCEQDGIKIDILFCDPPYNKKDSSSEIYDEIIEELNYFDILKDDAVVVFQHFTKTQMKENILSFEIVKQKKYSNNTLTFYMKS